MGRTGLLVWAACLLYIAAVRCDDDHGYVAKLQAALDSTGVPQDQIFSAQSVEPVGYNFACTPLTNINPVADNVHELSPQHIKVVGAMGDSMTAAMGAKANTIITNFLEYRGVSWSIGGDDDLSRVTTVPNIIKEYNPTVRGFSIKTGKATSSNARNNVAVSGAIAQDLPGQAQELVERITSDSNINVQEDWKLISIWIGGNDLCAVCKGDPKHSPDNYGAYIKQALDILKAGLPRTFVNLVQILDATKIAPLSGLICDAVHIFLCQCPTNPSTMPETQEACWQYQEKITNLVDDYDDDDDFAVVIQPFFVDAEMPTDGNGNPDKSYFAPDCFHFSAKGHRDAAAALWNNMLEPVGAKTKELILDVPLKCPTDESPYFFTKLNSGLNNNFHSAESDAGNTGGNAGGNTGGDNEDSGGSNFLAIILGSAISAYVVVVIVGVVIGGLVWRRRRRRRGLGTTVSSDGERVTLVTK